MLSLGVLLSGVWFGRVMVGGLGVDSHGLVPIVGSILGG